MPDPGRCKENGYVDEQLDRRSGHCATARDLDGRVIAPGDPGYDEARTIFYGGIDRRPAAIVRVAHAGDVARVIALARESGLELAVRSGGHSTAGHSVTDGGIVLDLREMRKLEIDAERRTAWAETGLTAGEYTAAAGAHGLATGFGDTGSVGIGGITLGGGVGFLARKYGLTIDDLLAAEIVTADGQLHHVDATNEPDLFWAYAAVAAIRPATRFQFRLHEVPQIVGGCSSCRRPQRRWPVHCRSGSNPRELTIIANDGRAAHALPAADLHGQLIILALRYAGDAGRRAGHGAIRKMAKPLADMVRPMSYRVVPTRGRGIPSDSGCRRCMDSLTEHGETILDYLQRSMH